MLNSGWLFESLSIRGKAELQQLAERLGGETGIGILRSFGVRGVYVEWNTGHPGNQKDGDTI